ncbi:MAG: hypothetical protein FWF60_00475 [Oscillospiraceae bacterium]|nr:hypothetical protein [Oscillospiraceae bacterium]
MRTRHIFVALLLAALLLALLAPGVGAAGFPLERSGSWQQMEFRCQADTSQDYEWHVQERSPDGDWGDVAPGATGVLTQELPAEGVLALVLKAQGRFRVSLVLGGAESEVYEVQLLDDSALQTALASARLLAANPNNRYDAAYIARLKQAIAAAEALYTQPAGVTREAMDAKTAGLRALAGSPVFARGSSALLNRLAPRWWKFVDAVTAPFRWLQDFPTWGSFFTLLAEGLRSMVNPQ